MKTLLLATSNKAKQEELTRGLQPLIAKGLVLKTLKDFPDIIHPEETGATFEENAKIKAMSYAEQTGLAALADDGGILIDILNGEPGVKSRRWPGYEASDQELIDYALDKLKDVPAGKRGARFQTCVCFYDPESETTICEEGDIQGHLSETPLDIETNGYPFRVLFIVDKYDKFYDHMTEAEHHEMNHRLHALRRVISQMEKYLLE